MLRRAAVLRPARCALVETFQAARRRLRGVRPSRRAPGSVVPIATADTPGPRHSHQGHPGWARAQRGATVRACGERCLRLGLPCRRGATVEAPPRRDRVRVQRRGPGGHPARQIFIPPGTAAGQMSRTAGGKPSTSSKRRYTTRSAHSQPCRCRHSCITSSPRRALAIRARRGQQSVADASMRRRPVRCHRALRSASAIDARSLAGSNSTRRRPS